MKPGAPAGPNPPGTPAKRRFGLDNRYLAPILITTILLVGQLTYGILEGLNWPFLSQLTGGRVNTYPPTLVAIITAIIAEAFLGWFTYGKIPHLASAYISGISVGILVRSPEVWPYILCSLLSITSKYAIRVAGRHLWNPSNLGISVMLFLAPATVGSLSVQWGNEIWPMVIVWILGMLIVYRVGRWHISLTYALSFVALAFVRTGFTGHAFLTEVAPITGPMYQLFTFFMVTDPKTTTRTKWSQILVVFIVAVVEAILRLNKVVYAPFYALFMVGPTAMLIEIYLDRRKGKETVSAGPPAKPAAAAAVAEAPAPVAAVLTKLN
jgi:hypothetical protein